MKNTLLICCLVILFCGCASPIAMKDDITMIQDETSQKIAVLDDSLNKQIQETNIRLEQIQKTQQQQQLAILNISEEMKNQIRDIKIAMDDLSQNQFKEFDAFKKAQEEKNNQFKQDINTLKTSQNDILKTSAALNDSMVNYQKDLFALKISIQQIADEIDSLDQQRFVNKEEFQNFKKDVASQIQVLLEEIVQHESEIIALKKQFSVSPKNTVIGAQKQGSATYYTVKKGDTISSIAKKYNTTAQKIKQLNNLQTDKILIGQKLLMP